MPPKWSFIPGERHGRHRPDRAIMPEWSPRSETNRQTGQYSKVIMMATHGPARLAASPQIKMGYTISEGTFGSGVKIGTIRKPFTECCGARHGIRAIQFSYGPHLATTSRQTITVLSSDFVAYWLENRLHKGDGIVVVKSRQKPEIQGSKRVWH